MKALLADLLVALHFLIVAFCVLGELSILIGAVCRWRWIRRFPFRISHLSAVLFVAGEAILGISCPLTEWEYALRMSAGQQHEQDVSFVARIIRNIIFYDFPAWFFTALYVGFGAVVLLTFIFVKPVRNRKSRRTKQGGLSI
jgi:hypothetical protein